MFFKNMFRLVSLSIIYMACVTNISANDEKISNTSMVKSLQDKYLIKYLTSYTEYPVKLIDNSKKPDTKWFKYGCNCEVEQSDTLRKYFSTEKDTTTGSTNLLLINYDKQTNSLLDHYEPKHDLADYTSEDYDDSNLSIYTLAYLNDFELLVKNLNKEEAEITCRVRVLISKGLNNEHETNLLERLDKSIHLKLKVPDHHRFLNRKTQNKDIIEKGHEKHDHHNHEHNNKMSEFKPKSSSSFKRSNVIDHNIKVQNKTSRFVNTLNEFEILQGPFKLFKANLDENNVTVSCGLVLKDYDNSHAFDTSIYKILNKNVIESISANSASLKNVSFALFLGIFAFLIQF